MGVTTGGKSEKIPSVGYIPTPLAPQILLYQENAKMVQNKK
jgi:hypothetical protein